jgi:carboxyl-terminal processing protease
MVVCTESEEIKMPMSVIVNQNTSGTSELFAFALSENCSAHTVGKTTAGKGYLQTAYTCSDGSVVMLSTAVLRTSGSGDFNGTGLKPEFDVTLSSDIDLNTISDEAALLTDAQLIKALEVTVTKDSSDSH